MLRRITASPSLISALISRLESRLRAGLPAPQISPSP
jgi:hypothetical protein